MEIIDLTSDDDLPASAIQDLTSAGDPRASSYVSHELGVKVEDESSTLAGSNIADSGESSPSTQRDDDIAQTESNPTDVGDLSPRNPQDHGSSSSDEGLPLSTIIARSKKRKRDSGDVRTSESKSTDVSMPFTPKALYSLVGSQSLKPGFNFFSVHKQIVNESHSENSKQDGKSKAPADESARIQQVRHSAKNTNPHILNIVREEVFGEENNNNDHKKKKKKNKQRGHTSSQEKPAKQLIQVDGQAFSTPAPPRAVSEAPETVRPKKKVENLGSIRQPKAPEETEYKRPHKRRKYSSREDTASGSASLAAASNTTRSQSASVDKLQGHRSKGDGIERSRLAGKDKASDVHKSSTRYRPGDSHRNPLEKATHHESQQKRDHARVRDKSHKFKRADSGRQQGEKAYLMAAPNERGAWAPNGLQRAGMASQRPLESRSSKKATSGRNGGLQEARSGRRVLDSGATGTQLPLESNSGRDEGLYEAAEEPHGLDPGTTWSQVPLESNSGHKARVGQNEDLCEDWEMPDARLQQSQRVHSSGGQQESHGIQSKLNTAQIARRLDKRQQTMGLAEKDLEDTRAFFSKHPSQLAQQRKTMFLDSIPPDVIKPSYPDRQRVVKGSTAGRVGRKPRTAIQTARKRDRYREKQIRMNQERLETQVNEIFPHESEEFKKRRVEAGLAKLREKYARNDEKREAEKAQGLLTVKFIEDSEGAEGDPIHGPPAAAPKGKRRGMPVAKALEPGATITLYVVYKSEPFEKGQKFGDYRLNRMEDQFFRKEDANKHAEAVLRNDRYDGSHLVSIQFRVGPEDGLFFGTKELADGKLVMCMVQKEMQMSSDLDLRDVFVRKELKQVYCPRYDVFHTHVVPKVFLESEEASVDGDKKKKSKSKTKTPTPDVGEDGPEPGENEHADGDSNSLFSGPPTPEPGENEHVDGDCDSLFSGPPTPEAGSEDEGDADSVATSGTLEPSQTGGNVGSLSWNDVDYVHEHVGSFTTLELANKEAIKVARERWRPRGARLDSCLYYRDAIKPSLDEVWAQELDVEKANLVFEVPEFEGHVNDRPWRFIYSTVYVRETRLEGPRDIGNCIVTGNGEDDGEKSGGEDGGDGEEDDEDD